MAAAMGRKIRKTLLNSMYGVSRKSTFMNSPNPTPSDNTPKGRHRNGEPFITPRESRALSEQTLAPPQRSFAVQASRPPNAAAGSERLPAPDQVYSGDC